MCYSRRILTEREYYYAPDGSLVEIVDVEGIPNDESTKNGLIVDSPIKAFIGRVNLFVTEQELKPVVLKKNTKVVNSKGVQGYITEIRDDAVFGNKYKVQLVDCGGFSVKQDWFDENELKPSFFVSPYLSYSDSKFYKAVK